MKVFVLTGVFFLLSCSSTEQKHKPHKIAVAPITHETISRLIKNWPEAAKSAASDIMSKYGLPIRASRAELYWKDAAPFNEIHVYNQELIHNFPSPHNDTLSQTISFHTPIDMADDLIRFKGSLIIDRTKGELTSRSDKESMNILALNLAHELVEKKLTAEKAREIFAKEALNNSQGEKQLLTSKLNFMPDSETADADEALEVKTPMRHHFRQAQEVDEVFKTDTPLEDL